MAAINRQINLDEMVDLNEKIIDIWGRRNPRFEKKYEKSVIRVISDYGIGASENTGAKGKVLGAGYEVYILAFFIGLYTNQKLPLSDDTDELKTLGQPLQYWGNIDSKKFRKAYPRIRSFLFIATVAKTDVDWIALDKGELKVASVVTQLIETMEQYANYGFSILEDKLSEDKGYFFSNRSFLDMFLQMSCNKDDVEGEDDAPEQF